MTLSKIFTSLFWKRAEPSPPSGSVVFGTISEHRIAMLAAHRDWARGRHPRNLWRGAVVSKLARCGENVRLRGSVVDEADIGDGTVVVDSHIMSGGARIGKDCRIEHAVVGPGVVLADASNVDHRMITCFDKRHELGPR